MGLELDSSPRSNGRGRVVVQVDSSLNRSHLKCNSSRTHKLHKLDEEKKLRAVGQHIFICKLVKHHNYTLTVAFNSSAVWNHQPSVLFANILDPFH